MVYGWLCESTSAADAHSLRGNPRVAGASWLFRTILGVFDPDVSEMGSWLEEHFEKPLVKRFC